MNKPVMYLDIDDVLLDWGTGGTIPRAAEGAREFLLWAVENYEVRWLTYWAPNGRLDPGDVTVLAATLRVDEDLLESIRGIDWTAGRAVPTWGVQSKLDGIAWTEHLILGRPFVWVEDETVIVPQGLHRTLHALGFLDCWLHVNTSRKPDSLRILHERLQAPSRKGPGRGPLSVADIAELVEEALKGKVCLDVLYSRKAFGGRPPRRWGDWPYWARDGWDAAVRLYFARREEEGRAKRLNDRIEASRAWDAIEKSLGEDGKEGWFHWRHVAKRLGMGTRQAGHMLIKRLGFEFEVHNTKKWRRPKAGPCVRCLGPTEVDRLDEEKVCPVCRLTEHNPATESELAVHGA